MVGPGASQVAAMSNHAPPQVRREAGIAGLRLRRGLFGKVILQVRYRLEVRRLRAPGAPAEWSAGGMSAWRDVDASNLAEVALVSKAMETVAWPASN